MKETEKDERACCTLIIADLVEEWQTEGTHAGIKVVFLDTHRHAHNLKHWVHTLRVYETRYKDNSRTWKSCLLKILFQYKWPAFSLMFWGKSNFIWWNFQITNTFLICISVSFVIRLSNFPPSFSANQSCTREAGTHNPGNRENER